MITAIHALLYSRDADAARAFFRDKLKFKSVDAGDGWLIFALPPAEIAVHPTHTDHGPELYLMCDDIKATLQELEAAGAKVMQPTTDQGYGIMSAIRIPGGVEIGIYEPRHPIAARLATKAKLPGARQGAKTAKRMKKMTSRKRRA